MKNVNTKTKTALAAVTLAAAALVTPLSASAADYQNCSDTTNSVAGGLIGGSVGAIAGREIAGRGDRSEGAILGAIIGGIAGAAVGDGASDCEKNTRYADNRRSVTTTHYPARTTVTNTRVQNVGFNSNRRNSQNISYGYDRGYDRRDEALYRIDREIEQTRYEGDRLKRQIRNTRGNARGLRRALEANGRQLDYLKSQRKRIKKGDYSRNDQRSNVYRGY